MGVHAKTIDALFSSCISGLLKAYSYITENLDSSELKRLSSAIFTRLENVKKLEAANVFLIGSILKLSGTPPRKLLDFFASFLKEKISLQRYNFCLSTIFNNTAPLPSDILFDLTEYTYLDRNIILKKSTELSGKFQKKKSVDLVLFLLILSNRSDLSNENLKLILLLLRSIAPKSVLHKIGPRHFEILNGIHFTQKDMSDGSGKRHSIRHTGDSEHASYYLDKHFSGKKSKQEEPDLEPISRNSSHYVQIKRKMQESELPQDTVGSAETVQGEKHTWSAGTPEDFRADSKAPCSAQPLYHTILGMLKRSKKAWIPALLIAAVIGTGIIYSTENNIKPAHTASVGQIAETASDIESRDETAILRPASRQVSAAPDGVPGKGDSNIRGNRISDRSSIIQNHYTVKKGDTLSGISKKYYDNANRYTVIAEENNIADPNLIYPGSTLVIPPPQEK